MRFQASLQEDLTFLTSYEVVRYKTVGTVTMEWGRLSREDTELIILSREDTELTILSREHTELIILSREDTELTILSREDTELIILSREHTELIILSSEDTELMSGHACTHILKGSSYIFLHTYVKL